MTLYKKAIAYSFLLHFTLSLFLIGSTTQHSSKHYVTKKSKAVKKIKIIQTTAIDSLAIDREIDRIKKMSQQKKINENNEKLALLKELNTAKKQKREEEQAIETLKLEQKKLLQSQKSQLRRQRRKVLALKKASALEKKRLIKSKGRRKALDKKLALEKKLRMDEDKRLANEKIEQQLKIAQEKAKAEELIKAKEQQLVNAEVDRFKSLLINAISQNWILPSNVDYSLSCRFEIKLARSGDVMNVTLLKTSGDPVLDRSAQTAIYNASPLPVPKTPEAFESFKTVRLTVKPENIR